MYVCMCVCMYSMCACSYVSVIKYQNDVFANYDIIDGVVFLFCFCL